MIESLTPSVLPPQAIQKKVQLVGQLRGLTRENQGMADSPSVSLRQGIQIHHQQVDPGEIIHRTIILKKPSRSNSKAVQYRIQLSHQPLRTGMKRHPDRMGAGKGTPFPGTISPVHAPWGLKIKSIPSKSTATREPSGIAPERIFCARGFKIRD